MADTDIEWTDIVWNIVRGCDLKSRGCKNCYAMKQAHRFSGPGQPYEGLTKMTSHGPVWTGVIRIVPEKLEEPLRRTKPARFFVNSMSDLFHDDVPFNFIDKVFAVMARAHQHTFQILTKRPERMLKYMNWQHKASTRERVFMAGHEMPLCALGSMPIWPLPNVWLGVSIEDQSTADERVVQLLEIPAAVSFLSCEPLLGDIDLTALPGYDFPNLTTHDALNGHLYHHDDGDKWSPARHVDWVIVGGESGPGACPMHPDWARSLRDQCKEARVPFFFKQWGNWVEQNLSKPGGRRDWMLMDYEGGTDLPDHRAPDEDKREIAVIRIHKKAAGRLLDGVEHSEYPA